MKRNPVKKLRLMLAAGLMTMMLSSFGGHGYSSNTTVNIKINEKKNDVTVSVKVKDNSPVQFYMFNIDGELVDNYNLNGSTTFTIHQVSKGTYTYECFSKDERLKSGRIILK